jgi:predicted Fe-Mo cluster-binding NifX family protein
MKIALPVEGNSIDGMMYGSFGRAKSFIIVDSTTFDFQIIENAQNLSAAQGAGIQSAQNVIKAGADVIITMNLGPKAHKVLCGSGTKIYSGKKATVKENIELYLAGELDAMTEANQESHWV